MAESQDFLFELYTEEIPAFYQIRAHSDWQKKFPQLLHESKIDFQDIKVGASARRIYVLVEGLSLLQRTEEVELKGPPAAICKKEGKPTPALLGFAKKAGIDPSEVEFRQIDGKEYACAKVKEGGASTVTILPSLLEKLVLEQKFPRSMRWGSLEISYARPVLSYYAKFGKELLSFSGGFFDVVSLSPEPVATEIPEKEHVKVDEPGDYLSALASRGVIVDPVLRKEKIIELLKEAAGSEEPLIDERLLDEVNYLVERPGIVRGQFDEEFLELPEILILSEMEEHQRYFGLRGKDGKLSSSFLVITNGNASDPESAQNIRTGNERVLRARLSDGAYFYHEDRKLKLAERINDLKRVVYQEGMGTVFDKKERIKKIAALLAPQSSLFAAISQEEIERSCDLIKADLTTQLVYEFDHLQGEIGAIYAAFDGEKNEVVTAIREHYLPRNQGDDLPETPLGVLLSLSDKLDNIMAGFLLEKQPTANQDPLGLRRQALYIIDIIIEKEISAGFFSWINQALDAYDLSRLKKDKSALEQEFRDFFLVRLATIFEKDGFDKKLVSAALYTGDENLYHLHLKLGGLRKLQGDPEFHLLMEAFKRMNNILSDFITKNPNTKIPDEPDSKLFSLPQEEGLMGVASGFIDSVQALDEKNLDAGSYEKLFVMLARSKKEIDAFFDHVMVMDEDISLRMNRLSLLNLTVKSVKELIDISRLQ